MYVCIYVYVSQKVQLYFIILPATSSSPPFVHMYDSPYGIIHDYEDSRSPEAWCTFYNICHITLSKFVACSSRFNGLEFIKYFN